MELSPTTEIQAKVSLGGDFVGSTAKIVVVPIIF
jgi:hypothetical protein